MFKVVYLDDNRVKLSMNITNPGDCQCLRMGTYSILVCDNGRILAKCMVDPAIVPFMEDYSRSFLHNNRTKAFVVSFSVAKDEDELPLVMYSMDATKSSVDLQTNREIVKEALEEPMVLIKKNMGRIRWKFLYHRYVKKYRKVKKTIMFMTEQSKTQIGRAHV